MFIVFHKHNHDYYWLWWPSCCQHFGNEQLLKCKIVSSSFFLCTNTRLILLKLEELIWRCNSSRNVIHSQYKCVSLNSCCMNIFVIVIWSVSKNFFFFNNVRIWKLCFWSIYTERERSIFIEKCVVQSISRSKNSINTVRSKSFPLGLWLLSDSPIPTCTFLCKELYSRLNSLYFSPRLLNYMRKAGHEPTILSQLTNLLLHVHVFVSNNPKTLAKELEC